MSLPQSLHSAFDSPASPATQDCVTASATGGQLLRNPPPFLSTLAFILSTFFCYTPSLNPTLPATPTNPPRAFTLPGLRGRSAFTLVEMLVVIVIIGILLALLVPALGPSSGRALDGATHQFTADLENARLIAIAERKTTRVLLPVSQANFSPSPAPSPLPWPTDITRRGYVIASQSGT
ncbi:MAG: type II secretion system GspH family protein, partial [Verrucomicrobiota bacterium]|nr:type II secretion system GspH family protein [Verrucomicrobiota bacterium]